MTNDLNVLLKKKARHYYDLGFNVLPVKIFVENGKEIKKPNVHSWKRGQTLRMTEEEFQSLPWGESEFFGVICGYNGFVSIDADNLSEEQYRKIDAILNQPVTEKIKTKRGHHWNFQSVNVRRGEKKTQGKSSLEYLGAGNFVIVGGLDNRYQRVNDNPPRQISDAHTLYNRVLEAVGWTEKPLLKHPEDLKEIRPCITAAMNGAPLEGSTGDKMRLCCAVEYLQAGYDVDQVVEVFRRTPAIQVDFSEEITRKKVKYAKEQEYKAWKCETIREELGFCLGDEDCEWIKKFVAEKKKKPQSGTKIGSYCLKKRGKKAFLFNDAGETVLSCNLDSVDGSQFKKKLREIAGLEEAEVNRSTASFMFALQSIKKSRDGHGEPEKPKQEDFDEETKSKAKALLCDPAFFYKLGKVFERGFVVSKLRKPRFIIGEERNKRLLGPLLIGASKLGMTSITKLLGDPATAKDTMLRMWLDLLPIKSVERSYFTAAGLRYSQQMKDADLLYIPDTPELRGEMGRQMRFMRADDGGLISEYATRDAETGEMVTKISRLSVKAVATTSNAITGDTALESGMWTLRTNGTEDLTKEVKKEKLTLRAGKRWLFSEDELKVWRCAFKILVSEELPDALPDVPFAEQLIALLESGRSESRRDPDKLCDLISLIAWVRRFGKSKDERDKADLTDLYFALQIGFDAITQTISELDEKEQRIFQAVENGEYASCRQVADETKIPYKTCYRYLDKLIEKGFVNKDKERGKNFYSILSEKTPKMFLISEGRNVEKPKELMEYVLNSVEGFSLSHEGTRIVLIDPITGDEVTVNTKEGEEPSITIENKEYSYPYEKVRSPKRSENHLSETEKKPKTLLPSKKRGKIEEYLGT